MLFAEGDANVGWVAIIMGAAGTFLGVLLQKIMDIKKQASDLKRGERNDAMGEWKEYTDRLEQRLTVVEAEGRQCFKENADLRAQVNHQQFIINQLSAQAGINLEVFPTPAIITANMDGMILEASPAVSPLFHYTVRELIGKNINILIPARYKQAHIDALVKMKNDGIRIWPGRVLQPYGLTREGEEIPITVVLTPVKRESGTLISAEIRRRVSSTDEEANLEGKRIQEQISNRGTVEATPLPYKREPKK